MTPKQVLWAHIRSDHRRRPPLRSTMEELSRWHARQHHQFAFISHYHEGINLGPKQRPEGWRTGEGAIKR